MTYIKDLENYIEKNGCFYNNHNHSFWFSAQPTICDQFNKVISYPEACSEPEKYRNGFIEIRSDEDFYLDAVLPFSYKDIPVRDIVEALWKEYLDEGVEYLPDKFCYKPSDHDKSIFYSYPLSYRIKSLFYRYTSISYYKREFKLFLLTSKIRKWWFKEQDSIEFAYIWEKEWWKH